MRVAIVGARNYPEPNDVRDYIDTLDTTDIIVSGGSGVVDLTAESYGLERGFEVDVFHANWGSFGRRAGPIRNTEIVRNSDRCVAFPYPGCKGTWDTVRKFRAMNKPVEIIRAEGGKP